ncbi:hypothetical protein [Rhizobium sp. IMFF44]|uniref:hypothetical protein n=1 Tax=Rhizobium sp. IMFF44 TaxID=3342350 RepID=UPI0035BB0C09
MNQFKKIQKLITKNEAAILAYREAGFDIYYQPERDNDGWFLRLMEKHNIQPATPERFKSAGLSVLMVND